MLPCIKVKPIFLVVLNESKKEGEVANCATGKNKYTWKNTRRKIYINDVGKLKTLEFVGKYVAIAFGSCVACSHLYEINLM